MKYLSKPLVIICIFVFFTFFRNFATFTKWGSYIFGDTAMYSLYITALAKNLNTVISYKDNFLFWNPSYLSVGLPTLSVVDLGVLYLPNVIIAIFARLSGDIMNVFPLYTLSLFAHLAFGAYFVYRLLFDYFKQNKFAALFGACLWIFSGFNLEFLGAASIMLTASYLPVCVYLKTRDTVASKYAYFLLLALSFLAGYPVVALTIMIYCFIFGLYLGRSWKKELFGLFLITFPLISPLYITTVLNFPLNIRSNINIDGFLSNATSLFSLIEGLLPRNTVFNTENKTNLVYMYFSLVGLFVVLQSEFKTQILKSKTNLFFILSGLLGVLLALGGVTIVPILSYFLIPAFSFFRRLSVFVLLPQFAYSLLIPQFVSSALKNEKLTKSSEFILKLLFILFVFPVAMYLLDLTGKTALENFYLSFSGIVVISFFAYFAFYINTYFKRFALAMLFFALYLEGSNLVLTKFYLNSETNPKLIFSPNRLTTKLSEIIKPAERVELSNTQHSYSTDHLNMEQINGYLSLASAYGVRVNEHLSSSGSNNVLRDMLGIKYVLTQDLADPDAKKLFTVVQNKEKPDYYVYDYTSYKWVSESSKTTFSIYERSTALNRLYLATSVQPRTQRESLLKEVAGLKTATDVFIDPTRYTDLTTDVTGDINILEYSRNYIKARVITSSDAYVANSTGFYPGWWAKVNGKWVKPIQTNWFMMGTYVPAGISTVEYVYIPYGFILGVLYILSAGGVLLYLYKHKHNYEKYI